MNADSILLMDEIPVDEGLPPSESLIKQYEKMVVSTLIRSFALDFMFQDQDGGNIDTPLTARKYGIKDQEAQDSYDTRGSYRENKDSFHKHSNYINKNRKASEMRDAGTLTDTYTGEKIMAKEKYDLDHTISAKEIFDDPAVYLTKLNSTDLANADSNLNHTNHSINRSKKQKEMQVFIKDLQQSQMERDKSIAQLKNKESLSDQDRKNILRLENLNKADANKMAQADQTARKEYNSAISKAFLQEKKTWQKVGNDASKQGMKMGLRQVLGVLLTEVWVIVRKKFPILLSKLKESFTLKVFLEQVDDAFREAFEVVKKKFKTLIETFANGFLAGVLASLSTFFLNLFTGTAKNTVKIIREFWGSVTEVFSLLAFNPNNLPPGELIRAISKIIVIAASVFVGTMVSETFSKLPIAQMPVIGEALTIFVGGMATGIISISLVYFIDHSKDVAKLVSYLNNLANPIDLKQKFYSDLNLKLKMKVSEIAKVPLDELNIQLEQLSEVTVQLSSAKTLQEKNDILTKSIKLMQLDLPYENQLGLKNFMRDKTQTLHFD